MVNAPIVERMSEQLVLVGGAEFYCKTRSNTGPQKRLRFAVVAE
jgi:hypothetical protein